MRWRITITVLFVWLTSITVALAEITGFVETFNGNGSYESVGIVVDGLDNPDWTIDGYQNGIARLQNGGLYVDNTGLPEEASFIRLSNPMTGSGSFIERVEIKNPDLGVGLEDGFFNGVIAFAHIFNLNDGAKTAGISIALPHTGPNDDPETDVWELEVRVEDSFMKHEVSKGDHLAFEIEYDAVVSQTYFTFDNDINDNLPATKYGPLQLIGKINNQHESALAFVAGGASSVKSNGLLDFWSLTELLTPGDYDDDRLLTVADVDLLMTRVREGPFGERYDLNDDGTLDSSDVRVWVEDLKGTWLGDANLDGEFNSTDLVAIFAAGQYDDDIALNSTWATGDWNADAEFDSGDLVIAFAGGGYEFGPREAAANVPEPSSLVLMLAGALMLVRLRH